MTLTLASHLLTETPPGFAMHRVATRDDWTRVEALRYEALAARADIAKGPDRAHTDAHDHAVNGATFLLSRNGRALGSVRVSVSPPGRRFPLPAMDTFAREIGASIGLDCGLVEASLLVVDPACGADPRIAVFHLLKAPMLLCAAADRADWLVAAVREDEIGFYRRMLNMEILSGAESCPGMANPRVLMGLQYREHAALLFRRIPALEVTLADEAEYAATGGVRFAQRGLRQQAA